jgi:diacylglycerol kinase (ATP)
MRTCVILNARAGSAEAATDLRADLASRPDIDVCEPTSAADVRACVARALEAGCDTVVAAGGDGTVHTVVNALAADLDRARLAVLPLGTGNDLCRTLAVPFDPLAALALLDTGSERRIDLVRVDTAGRSLWCANVAAGGFTGQMQEQLTDDVKALWGPLAYLRGAVGVLPNLTGYQTTLRLDDGVVERIDALNVLVANGRTAGGGLQVAPLANPEDGLLDVVTVFYRPLLELTGVAALLLAGDYLRSDYVIHQRARRVQVVSTPGMWFSIDGELLSNESITFTVRPRALRVLVGPDYTPEPAEGGWSVG